MADYLGRTGSCTEGRLHPDTNLSAYAREHGFQTALIGAKFKGTNRLYTYWGHTGMKRGHYAKVLVPRPGSRQEETVVRIAAVVPALELKAANCRTAKHIQAMLDGEIPNSMKIPLPSDPFTQSWRNAASMDIVPAPPTEHAKVCMAEIDYVLGDGMAAPFKTGPLANADLSGLELRVTADAELVKRGEAVHKQFEHYMDLQHIPRDVIESIIKEYPAVGAGRPKSFRPSYLTDLGPCGRETTQETIMSAKIETITYVTLPGSSTRFVAKDVAASVYFEAIATLEAQIAKLEKINTKPRSLEQQIEDLKAQVDELAALCDLYHAKKEPAALCGQNEQSEPGEASTEAGTSSYIARPGRD